MGVYKNFEMYAKCDKGADYFVGLLQKRLQQDYKEVTIYKLNGEGAYAEPDFDKDSSAAEVAADLKAGDQKYWVSIGEWAWFNMKFHTEGKDPVAEISVSSSARGTRAGDYECFQPWMDVALEHGSAACRAWSEAENDFTKISMYIDKPNHMLNTDKEITAFLKDTLNVAVSEAGLNNGYIYYSKDYAEQNRMQLAEDVPDKIVGPLAPELPNMVKNKAQKITIFVEPKKFVPYKDGYKIDLGAKGAAVIEKSHRSLKKGSYGFDAKRLEKGDYKGWLVVEGWSHTNFEEQLATKVKGDERTSCSLAELKYAVNMEKIQAAGKVPDKDMMTVFIHPDAFKKEQAGISLSGFRSPDGQYYDIKIPYVRQNENSPSVSILRNSQKFKGYAVVKMKDGACLDMVNKDGKASLDGKAFKNFVDNKNRKVQRPKQTALDELTK